MDCAGKCLCLQLQHILYPSYTLMPPPLLKMRQENWFPMNKTFLSIKVLVENISMFSTTKERGDCLLFICGHLATSLRTACGISFTVPWRWLRDVASLSTGKTCQYGPHRVQEIPAKRFRGGDLCGLWVWQNRIQWAHSVAEISNYNRDAESTREHLDRGRRQGQFLLVGWFFSLTNVAKGKTQSVS